jgi:hypothetical protein
MRSRRLVAVAAIGATLCASSLSAQSIEKRVLPAALGTVAGVAGGGYLAVSIVVLESRFGEYLHDFEDLLGWRSLPVIAGGITGAAIGAWDGDRLYRTVLFGAAGLGVGFSLGFAIGELTGETREARWAGAAIGGGFGLIAGNLFGLLLPEDRGPAQIGASQLRIPLEVRIPF